MNTDNSRETNRKSEKNQTREESLDREQTQCLKIESGGGSRTIEFWEDGTIIIHGKIGEARRIESCVLFDLIESDFLDRIGKEISVGVKFEDNEIFTPTTLRIRKISHMKRGRKQIRIVISGKEITQGYRKRIAIRIKPEELALSEISQLLIKFTNQGYEIQKFESILQPTMKLISKELKTRILQTFYQFRQRAEDYQPIACFRDYYGKEVKIFDDKLLAAEFNGAVEGKTAIRIPIAIANLVINKKKKIVLIRGDQVTITKVHKRTNKAYLCSTHVGMTSGVMVKLLWIGLERTERFNFMIASLKEGKDLRSHFAFAFYNNYLEEEEGLVDNFQGKIAVFKKIISEGHIIPIYRLGARNSTHSCTVTDFIVSKMMDELDQREKETIILREALVMDKKGTFFKSVDWYIVSLKSNGQLEKYPIELKTCISDEKTRVLQSTIAEYSQLSERVPEAGIPIIIVNWTLDKEKWTSYASRFGVVVIDPDDLFEMVSNKDFFGIIRNAIHKSMAQQPSNTKRKLQRSKAKRIIENWKTSLKAPREEITDYCNYMRIQIQNLLHLLKFYKVTSINLTATYYRKGFIPIEDPKPLAIIHAELEKGTEIIVREELKHCERRIQRLKNRQISVNNQRGFERRRQTTDLARLELVRDDLRLLLSYKDYWGVHFRPIGVKMLVDKRNQGNDFEEQVYHKLSREGVVVIRHVSVMIGNRTREVDMIAFNKNGEKQKIIISCSDSSNQSKFHYAKKNIINRFLELITLKEEISFEEAQLHIKVANNQQEKKVKEWISERKGKRAKIKVVIVNEQKVKENTNQT